MASSPSTSHTDCRFRYMYGSRPASLSLLWVAEYTMSTPRPAMATADANRPRSTCRQAAVAPRRRGNGEDALAVAIVSSGVRGQFKCEELVDAACVAHGLRRLTGKRLEDTSGDGGSGRRPEAGLLHHHADAELWIRCGSVGHDTCSVLYVPGLV